MIRYTLLSLTLLACNSFEAQDNGTNPVGSSFVIIDGDITNEFDSENNERTTPSPVVMDLPELGLKVIEVNVDTEVETEVDLVQQNDEANNPTRDATEDTLLRLQNAQEVELDSPLAQALTAQHEQRIAAVSTFPSNLLKEAQTEHALKILHVDDQLLYTSQLLQSIVASVEQESTILYIPLYAEDMPEILFDAIDYGQHEGIRIFDARGYQL